jgi:colanic acid/amylovoran biosynthesis protein
MSDPQVSIIMRSFNEGWALRETLPALRAQEYTAWELIVVDSGSTDGSLDLLRAAQPAHLVQITPPEYNPSCVINQGMRLARSDFGIFLNADYEQHFRTGCAVVEMLLRELDAGIIFVPHVQEISPKNDDRVLATQSVRHFNFDPRLQIAGGDYSASEFKGIISQCDMVVSERMHSCIAGLSSAVCTVAIGYSIKAEGILGDLFEPEQIRGGLLLPVKEFLDPAFACEKVRQAWNMRDAVKARLTERLPSVRQKAALTFDLIARRMTTG